MWAVAYAGVLASQLDDVERSRVISCAGPFAGDWLGCLPVTIALRAVPRHYQLALAMRLGADIEDLSGPTVTCGRPGMLGCGHDHDARGRHPQHCTSHNRGGLTTTRHDAVQWALRTIARAVGRVVHVVGHQAWFTGGALVAAGLDPLREALYADLVIPHYRAPGRHLFIDVAVTTPDTAEALEHSPSSRDHVCIAAGLRSTEKHRKYDAACAAMGASFRGAIVERFGACSDDMCGLVRQLCGDGDRDASSEDWSFTAPSRVTYHMQRIVFAAVIGDAAMLDAVIERDVRGVVVAAGAGQGGGAAAAGGRGGAGGGRRARGGGRR